MSGDIIDRLRDEMAGYSEGSHMRLLCLDSIEAIGAHADSGHHDALNRSLETLDELQGMLELYKEDNEMLLASNAELTALLTKKGA